MTAYSFSLFKKGSYFYIQYTDSDGRRRQRSTGCEQKSDALKFLSEFKTLERNNLLPKPFTAFVEEFLQYAESNYSPGTLLIYKTAKKHFLSFFGNIRISQIRPYHFDQYKSHRLATVSEVTTNMELRSLRALLGVAVRWQLLDANPFAGLALARAPDTTPAYFTREDLAKFVGFIHHTQFRDIVIIAVATGMRRSEIANLTWDRVDLPKRVIHIESAGNFRTKNGKRRSIAINETATLLLQTRSMDKNGEYVFSKDDHPVNEDWITKKFGKAIDKSGLDERLHFHSLRHTHASWLAQANVSIYQISKLLGHSDVKTTQTFYTHLLPDQMHQQVEMLDIGFPNSGASEIIR